MRWWLPAIGVALLGCGDTASGLGAGETCIRTAQCDDGLACVAGRCSSDLTGLEGGGGTVPSLDAGQPVDAGPPPDGAPPIDSGPPPVTDAGPPPPDSGPPPMMDSGPPPMTDSGPEMTDAGTDDAG
jgi:hypothetical protein